MNYQTTDITGLGLVASGKRRILSGAQYDNLYDRSALLGTNPIIGGDKSDTYDTLNHMASIVVDTLTDTEKVAATLAGRTLEETLRNVWNHVYNHFQYEKDALGIEQIRRPSRSWMDRRSGIDCDCMSVVISSLLHHLRIPHAFRKATYNESTGWQHVYVVVPKNGTPLSDFNGARKVARSKYYVLDCVVDKFDYEVPTLKKFDKIMKIQYLNGIDLATLNGGVSTEKASLLSAYPAIPTNSEELVAGFGCEFQGLENLSGSTAAEIQNVFLNSLRQHLINTRSILKINPALTAGIYEPKVFLSRLDTLIACFDNPTSRSKMLAQLAAAEDAEGLSGLGAPKIFKKVAAAVKTVAHTTSNAVQTAAKATGHAVAQAAKTVAKVVVRYNPATVAVRSGLLLAMKINLFRLAEKLGYGYWPESKAQEKGLDVTEWRKAQATLEKVRKMHKALGGKVEKLDAAIKAGWQHGVKKNNLLSGLYGSEEKKVVSNIASNVAGKVARKDSARKAKSATVGKRISAAQPLLKLIDSHLAPIQYGRLLKKTGTSELEDFLQAVRTNRNGIATKMSLAYKPVHEAATYDKAHYKQLLSRVRLAERLVTSKGGTPEMLRAAVTAGKEVAMSKAALGEVVSTAPAATILATIAGLLRKVNFSAMFKGRASSPNASDAEVKGAAVTAELDATLDDEGDPNATAMSADQIASDFFEPDAVQSLTPATVKEALTEKIVEANPIVGKIASAITSSPETAAIAAQLVTAAPEVASSIAKSNPQVAAIAEVIKNNPVAAAIASNHVAKKNPALAKHVASAVRHVAPTAAKVAGKLIDGSAKPTQVARFTKPGAVPVETENGVLITMPTAQALQAETSKKESENQTLKVVAIAGASVAGLILLSRASRSAASESKAPAAASALPLQGVKTSKSKTSQRTQKAKKKRVMAITI